SRQCGSILRIPKICKTKRSIYVLRLIRNHRFHVFWASIVVLSCGGSFDSSNAADAAGGSQNTGGMGEGGASAAGGGGREGGGRGEWVGGGGVERGGGEEGGVVVVQEAPESPAPAGAPALPEEPQEPLAKEEPRAAALEGVQDRAHETRPSTGTHQCPMRATR